MALLKKVGYGQVEPNRIQGRKQGRVIADIPVKPETVEALGDRIENGLVLAVNAGTGFEGNLKTGHLDLPKEDSVQVGLVYTENKLYDDLHGLKDFALFTVNPTISHARQSAIYNAKEEPVKTVVPRLLGFTLGDVFTTNQIAVAGGSETKLPEVGTKLTINDKGQFDVAGTIDLVEATVVQKTTMPDGQLAVKLQITGVKA